MPPRFFARHSLYIALKINLPHPLIIVGGEYYSCIYNYGSIWLVRKALVSSPVNKEEQNFNKLIVQKLVIGNE